MVLDHVLILHIGPFDLEYLQEVLVLRQLVDEAIIIIADLHRRQQEKQLLKGILAGVMVLIGSPSEVV